MYLITHSFPVSTGVGLYLTTHIECGLKHSLWLLIRVNVNMVIYAVARVTVARVIVARITVAMVTWQSRS
jgi:hypothetical protein